MTLAIFKYAVIQADFQVPYIELAIPILLTDQVVIVQQPIRLVMICIWGMTIEGIVGISTIIIATEIIN